MRILHLALALVAVLLISSPASAGVIVLKNGKVLIGDFSDEDVSEEEIKLHPIPGKKNVLKVPRHKIRWFSTEGKEPSDEYWKQFLESKIDGDWEPQRVRYRQRQKDKVDEVPAAEVDRELLETKRVEFRSKDGLPIFGELYGASDKSRPIILLCHQAKSSRGEYRAIAPRLIKKGFICLAIDQRSGEVMNKVVNLTAQQAKEQKKATGYADARQDIEAAISWIRKEGFTGKLTLWGSSYSAALALMIGASEKEVSAVLSFSPGDYLKPKGTVAGEAAGLTVPLLILAPERERSQATALAKVVKSKEKTVLIHADVMHGSRTLFKPKPSQSKAAWEAVFTFLEAHSR